MENIDVGAHLARLGGRESTDRMNGDEEPMQTGVVFPHSEIGSDASAIRAYGEGIEALGYTHLLVYDHVVGADPNVHKGWNGYYDVDTIFHEPFVMFGNLAAATSLELVAAIIRRLHGYEAVPSAPLDTLSGPGTGGTGRDSC
jgi:hypothetical protein